MDLGLLHNLVLLRALMIFAIAATSLVLVGIIVAFKAWLERDSGSGAAQATISNRVPRSAPAAVQSPSCIFHADSTSSAKT